MIVETLPLVASVISSFSRAGLNVVDRKQFRQERACPLVVGYWNNLLPVLLILPFTLFTPAFSFCLNDLFSLEIIFLSALIQCVAYSFSFAFKVLRVTDLAVLSKSADITVPLVLVVMGVYSISYSFFFLLPLILLIFVCSAGIKVVKKTYKASIALVFVLTIQGIYAFFVGLSRPFGEGLWDSLSVAFSVLVWRFIFSGVLLFSGQKISCLYKFPSEFLSRTGFYLRGFLTAVTQITFILAITANNLMIVWPILNATGFLAAVFAYLFLGEKLGFRDFLFILFAFLLTGLVVLTLHYENI